MTSAYFEISSTGPESLVNVETAFGIFPPINQFALYTTDVTGLDGLIVAKGLPSDIWSWGYIYRPSFELLRTFCAGASVRVWVRTCLETRRWTDSSKYGYFTGIFAMPARDDYQIKDDLVYPFRAKLSQLVQYYPGD